MTATLPLVRSVLLSGILLACGACDDEPETPSSSEPTVDPTVEPSALEEVATNDVEFPEPDLPVILPSMSGNRPSPPPWYLNQWSGWLPVRTTREALMTVLSSATERPALLRQDESIVYIDLTRIDGG